MSIISGGFPKYSIRDYAMGLRSNGYVLKDVGCGEYATTTAICHGGDTEYGLVLGPHQDDLWDTTAVCFTHGENRGGDCTYPQRMRNLRAAAGLPDAPPSSVPRPKKGKGASASAAPPRLEEPYGRWSGGPDTLVPMYQRGINSSAVDGHEKISLVVERLRTGDAGLAERAHRIRELNQQGEDAFALWWEGIAGLDLPAQMAAMEAALLERGVKQKFLNTLKKKGQPALRKRLRDAFQPAEYKRLKDVGIYVTWAYDYQVKRGKREQGTPTGLCFNEFDGKDNPGLNAVALRDWAATLPTTVLAYLSIGGGGAHIVTAIPDPPEGIDYSEWYEWTWEAVDLMLQVSAGDALGLNHPLVSDPQVRDVSRPAYLSYDPAVYFNPAAMLAGRLTDESRSSSSWETRKEREAQQKTDAQAVQEYIGELVVAQESVYWLQDFWEKRNGGWYRQDANAHRLALQNRIELARLSAQPALITARGMGDYMAALSMKLTPPCVDMGILSESDRLRHFNLDTGELLDGTAFSNGIIDLIGPDAQVDFRPAGPRHFFSSSRPYPFAQEEPGRPLRFDEWLAGRLPDPVTRVALWELIGATVLERLHGEQRIVVLMGPGRSGKGTLLRVLEMLVGRSHVFSVTGGPRRLGTSQFGLSQLQGAALLLLPDMPPVPTWHGLTRELFDVGLSNIKSIAGGDPISIERKNRDQITARVTTSIWMDSNFDISGFIEGTEDSFSWSERLIPIPFTQSIAEAARQPHYEDSLIPEMEAIAWYAVQAYAERVRRGSFTWSSEMRIRHMKLSQGKQGALGMFMKYLQARPGAEISRKDLRAAAARALDAVDLTKDEAERLYQYARALDGVEERKREGCYWFVGLGVESQAG